MAHKDCRSLMRKHKLVGILQDPIGSNIELNLLVVAILQFTVVSFYSKWVSIIPKDCGLFWMTVIDIDRTNCLLFFVAFVYFSYCPMPLNY